MDEGGEGTPTEAMKLSQSELKKSDALGKQSIIAGKLREYLMERYPEKYQQIHAHVMSINTRALVGMLFTPGLLEEEIEQIINGRENTGNRTVLVEDEAVNKEEEKATGVERKEIGTYGKGDELGKSNGKSMRTKRD